MAPITTATTPPMAPTDNPKFTLTMTTLHPTEPNTPALTAEPDSATEAPPAAPTAIPPDMAGQPPAASRLRRTFDLLLVLGTLTMILGLALMQGGWIPGGVPFDLVLACTAGWLVLNASSLLYSWWRPVTPLTQSSRPVRWAMLGMAVVMLCEGVGSAGVVVARTRAHDAIAAYESQRRQDLAAAMACERAADPCWQEAARNARTAMGLASMVMVGPKDALDAPARRAILQRAIGMARAESTGAALQGLRAVDRACARSLLCTVSLGRVDAQDALSVQQTLGMIDLLAQRLRDRGEL